MNKSNFFNITRATSTITVEGIGEVHCRELSAGAVALLQKEANEMSILAAVVLGGVVDESNGKPMFTAADKSKVLEMPMKPLQEIAEEVLKLTGLDGDAGEEIPNE